MPPVSASGRTPSPTVRGSGKLRLDVPPDVVPDVVVVDAAAANHDALQDEATLQRWLAADIGVVAIGENPLADVRLPPDFSLRELQLACGLLAEAVRWRRECHRARQLQLTYSQLALTDALTGLPNRRAWEEEVRERSARGESGNRPICLALFDVDHFKSSTIVLGTSRATRFCAMLAAGWRGRGKIPTLLPAWAAMNSPCCWTDAIRPSLPQMSNPCERRPAKARPIRKSLPAWDLRVPKRCLGTA